MTIWLDALNGANQNNPNLREVEHPESGAWIISTPECGYLVKVPGRPVARFAHADINGVTQALLTADIPPTGWIPFDQAAAMERDFSRRKAEAWQICLSAQEDAVQVYNSAIEKLQTEYNDKILAWL